MGFRYKFRDHLLFYWSYFYRKVFCLWFEVKRPKVQMFLYEMVYSAKKFVSYDSLYSSPFNTDMVETVFGVFRIRPRTVDMSNVSPAFERKDVDYMLQLISGLVKERKKIAFLDIGGDIGTFSVTVGNRFKDYGGLDIMTFEPAVSSFKLIEENIKLNGLTDKTTLYNWAIYDQDDLELYFSFNTLAPGSSGLSKSDTGTGKVITRTLDTLVGDKVASYDTLVLKMDVEGVESEILRGAARTLAASKETYLLVEDFINPEVITTLEGLGATFITKLTPYNSFWVLRHPR